MRNKKLLPTDFAVQHKIKFILQATEKTISKNG